MDPLSAADLEPPVPISVTPPRGTTVATLDQLSVLFSEPVTGVQAADLLINEIPAQASFGASNLWTFFFSQPIPGTVSIRWDINHTVTDTSGNRLNQAAVEARWSYTLTDLLPPGPQRITPTPEATLAFFNGVEVLFSESVEGVTAGSLFLNGVPALNVTGSGAGPYHFSYTAPASTQLTLSWAPGGSIHDLSPAGNLLPAGDWTYRVEPSVAAARIQINEIVANNLNGLTDEEGATEDWIELWNRGPTTVDLLGWGLSDDPLLPTKWVFPAVSIASGQYRVVFASGKDRRSSAPGAPLHTNFRLNTGGGTLLLSDPGLPARTVDAWVNTPEQRGDLAYGRSAGGDLRYLDPPTPGAPNASGLAYFGFVAPTVASVASGFFDQPLALVLQSPTPDATLHYTLDGSVPTRFSPTYLGPLRIEGSANRAVATVRTVGFKSGLLPSTPSTFTYIFPDEVLHQPANPAGFPTTWISPGKATTSGDYAMDPRVTTNAVYRPMIREGLLALPTVSLVTDEKLLFEPAQGVYVQRDSKNRKPAHVELILPDGSPGFSLECGFEVQGGSSPTDAGSDWKSKNLSLRLVFSGDFGNKKLKYPLYPGGPVDEFDTLILDSALNMVWNHMTDADQRNRGQYAREQFVNELMMQGAAQAPRGRFVHLYINGLYWGMKNLHERPEEKWAASYWGGDPADYDVIKHTSDTVIAGSATNYAALLSAVHKTQSNITNYVAALQQIDLDWFIDYMMVNFWAGNDDWDQHNWYAIRSRKLGSPGWRFVSWDAEHVLKDVNEDVSTISNFGAPSDLFTAFRASPEFRLRWADHMQKHFFNGGMFYVDPVNREWDPAHPERNRPAALYMQVIDTLDPAIVCESARWGDVARPAQPYTRNVEWLRELQSLLFITNSPGNTVRYFPLRSSNVFGYFRRLGLYPTNAAPPAFVQHGGRVAPGFVLSMTHAGPGTIYYTTDGNDPRVFRAGAISSSAVEYIPAAPPVLTASWLIKARTLNGTNWSALSEAQFEVGAADSPLRFTEIQYNPIGGDAFEFLELQNTSALDLDLSGWSVEGIGFTFVPGSRLASGGTLVLASGIDTNSWKLRYPGSRIGGAFTGALSNGGERLALISPDGVVRLSMAYDDEGGWPATADGGGPSLEILDPDGNPNDPANWRASLQINGSPGLPNATAPASRVLINEILAENAGAVSHAGSSPDYIELHNPGTSAVELSGWSLSDGGDPRRFVFSPGTALPADGYLVIWCDTNATPGLHSGFALHREGELISLYDPTTNRVDAVLFGLQVANQSLGRSASGWILNQPTPGAINVAASTAPQTELWINELLVKHLPGQRDWIELFNRNSNNAVSLKGISFRVGGRTVRYSANAFLPARGFLQLWADGQFGVNQLDLHLPADGTEITLLDAAGKRIESESVSAQTPEGASVGSYPDGTPTRVVFDGSSTPGFANAALATYSGPIFHEILAKNFYGLPGPAGTFPDFIELQNPTAVEISLDGLILEVNEGRDGAYRFPPGISLAPHELRVVWCDGAFPMSISSALPINTGFGLPGQGAVLSLRDAQQARLAMAYGFQIDNSSIGSIGSTEVEWGLLSSPTPGTANSGAASLGDVTSLAINEWMANPITGPDWFELFNRDRLAVSLDGVSATDDPSIVGRGHGYRFPSLSYIGSQGFLRVVADADLSQGADHAPFRLRSEGGTLLLNDTTQTAPGTPLPLQIDAISYGTQTPGASQGRWPDGGAEVIEFLQNSSPEAPNGKRHPSIRLNEFIQPSATHMTQLELFNSGETPVDVGGWFLTDDATQPRKMRLVGSIVVPPKGYGLIDRAKFIALGESALVQFLNYQAFGQTLVLSEADSGGRLSGYQTTLYLVPSPIAAAIGYVETCDGPSSAPLQAPTLLAPNAEPLSGSPAAAPLISLQPQDSVVAMNQTAKFIVAAMGDAPLEYQWFHNGHLLAEATQPQLEVREAGPGNAGDYHVRVSSAGSCAFSRTVHLITLSLPLLLSQPSAQAVAPGKTATFSSRGSTENPPLRYQWLFNGSEIPQETNSNLVIANAQLNAEGDYQVRVQDTIGSLTSLAARLTVKVRPSILAQPSPLAQAVALGSNALFSVSVSGSLPMTYSWRKVGKSGSLTNITLFSTTCVFRLPSVGTNDAGKYYVAITNFGGLTIPAYSQTSTLAVVLGPRISLHPQDGAASPGGSVSFSVSAGGDTPLSYQWLHNGFPIPGAGGATLQLEDVQALDAGSYSVAVTNPGSTVESLSARLFVMEPMRLSVEEENDVISIRWVAMIGRVYRIESAEALSAASWQSTEYQQAAVSTLGRFDVPLNKLESERYWRLVAEEP